MNQPVIDVCCGPRKFWFDKADPRAVFLDNRNVSFTVKDKSSPGGERKISVSPDIQADFRCLPFPDNSFYLAVFDPPHMIAGKSGHGYMAANYGELSKTTWKADLASGFAECFRVLKSGGTLIFKWAEISVQPADILALSVIKPLFGNRMPKAAGTHWIVFMKPTNGGAI